MLLLPLLLLLLLVLLFCFVCFGEKRLRRLFVNGDAAASVAELVGQRHFGGRGDAEDFAFLVRGDRFVFLNDNRSGDGCNFRRRRGRWSRCRGFNDWSRCRRCLIRLFFRLQIFLFFFFFIFFLRFGCISSGSSMTRLIKSLNGEWWHSASEFTGWFNWS